MVDPNFFNSAEAYQILQEYPGADDERLNWQPLLLDLEEPTTRYLVKLYADDYYLATIDLANPFELQCERSEDGLWLAISEFSLSDWGSAYQNLRWLNLTQPTNIQSASQSLTTRGYAFSPDGAYLAVSGILRGQQGVYLIDTANGDLQQINDDEIVQSLVWKPDGTQLAYIFGYDDGNYPYKMRVVDIISGEETTYELEFQGGGYGTIIPDPSWPLLDWGVSFPSNPGDLGTCAKPPQQTAEE
jgi:Tol biopolymer transport system component